MSLKPLTTDPPWLHAALRMKSEAGRRAHLGTDDDYEQPNFDFLAAIVAEHLDIVNYADAAIARGQDLPEVHASRASSLTLLEQFGKDVVMRAASAAFARFTTAA